MAPALRISLLGDFLLLADDTPVTSVAVPRMRSLLAFLLLHRHAPQDRSRLAFLLWPDSSEAQAHTNLRKLLHQLRQAFPQGETFLCADKQTLQWRAAPGACTLDVEEFEQARAQAEDAGDTTGRREALERALRAYRGDLLPGCYDEWLLLERDRLRQAFLIAAQALSTLLEQEREYEAALVCAHQLLRHDPLHETSYRQLMRLYALLGDRAAALRAYHTCARLLENELGAQPSELTREAYTALMRSEHPSGPQSAFPATRPDRPALAPLQGRKAQWLLLQQCWQTSTGKNAGSPRLVLLTGEAGIGKTRLASELELRVSRLGQVTASARCYPGPGQLPYAPITSWLRSNGLQSVLATLDPGTLGEVARLVPEVLAARPGLASPAPMSESWQRQFFYAALARAVLSVRQPLLLLLDDLQWCDQETLQWLHYLLHFSTDARLLILCTIRVEETSSADTLVTLLETLQRDDLVTEIPLGSLTAEETTALATSLLNEQLDPASSAALYRESEGNPLFIVEIVRANAHHKSSGKTHAQGTRPLLASADSALPAAVQAVLSARLAQLSTQARTLANLAAVIGREFAFPVLLHALAGNSAEAARQLEEHAVQGLDELWQRRMVREQDTGGLNAYEFSHDKIRAHIYTSLSPILRKSSHLKVAQALEAVYAQDLDAACGQIAAHYEQAGLPIPAAAFYQRAGQVASRVYAHAEARNAFARAAALLAPPPDWSPESAERARQVISLNVPWQTLAQISTALGDAHINLDAQEEARLAYQQALAVVPAEALLWQARLQRKIAVTQSYSFVQQHSVSSVNSSMAFAETERILTTIADPANSDWREEWLELQFARIWGEPETEMATALEKARPIVEQYGTPEQRRLFAEAQGVHNATRSRFVIPAHRVAAWRANLAELKPTTSEIQHGMDLAMLGIGLLSAAQFDEAEEQLRLALRLGERTGNARLQRNCLTFLPFALRQRGQVEETRAILARAQALGIAQNNAVLTGHQAWVAWRSGDLVQAEACARASLQTAPARQARSNPFLWTGRWPLIAILQGRQQTASALAEIRQLFDPTQQPPRQPLASLLTALLQTWDAGEQEKARALLQEALPLAAELGYL